MCYFDILRADLDPSVSKYRTILYFLLQQLHFQIRQSGNTKLRYGVERDSSVSIVTCYGLDGPGIESRWGRDFLHQSRPALDLT